MPGLHSSVRSKERAPPPVFAAQARAFKLQDMSVRLCPSTIYRSVLRRPCCATMMTCGTVDGETRTSFTIAAARGRPRDVGGSRQLVPGAPTAYPTVVFTFLGLVRNVPYPEIRTSSPLARASPMAANTPSTASLATSLLRPARVASRSDISALFTRSSSRSCYPALLSNCRLRVVPVNGALPPCIAAGTGFRTDRLCTGRPQSRLHRRRRTLALRIAIATAFF